MSKTIFSKPEEVNFGFPAAVQSAILHIENNLKSHNFTFTPPYNVRKYFTELKSMLDDSGWVLSETIENQWKILPKL